MSKKSKKESTPEAGTAPLIPPSAEELRRLHIETNTRDTLQSCHDQLGQMIKGNLKKTDRLQAIIAIGESIMCTALHTRGRLRALTGQSDAFLEATAANVLSGLRKALKTFELHDKELTVWSDTLEIIKPVQDDLKRVTGGLDRPGVKTAVAPGGGALLDDDGDPTFEASQAAAPAPPAPDPEPEPEPAAAPVPREIPTLGIRACDVIDVDPEPEPAGHPFDGLDDDAINDLVSVTLDKLEEAGVEEGLKRKDWKKPYDAWCAILPFVSGPDDEDLPGVKHAFTLLLFALETRKPVSWSIPTEAEIESFHLSVDFEKEA